MRPITLTIGLEKKSSLSHFAAALKLHTRALAHFRMTRHWLGVLNSDQMLRELAHAQPRLIHKVYRPWLSQRMNRRERLAALVGHYRFILRQGLGALVAEAARGPVQLAAFAGKSGTPYSIELCAIVPMEREGELVLQLRRDGTLVCSVAFSFLNDGPHMQIGVGCIQGPSCGAGLELMREATRELHGLRPKSLLVRLLRHLGHASGCVRMVLVCNKNRTAARTAQRDGKIKACYDSLWLEMGATARPDGDYELACSALQPPELEAVPSKKRSEMRKRHDMLALLNADVLARLVPQTP
ncbi:VirK/YbjX family protein [Massilia sp. MB5]|uniref:DUF535 family protein n=1 Tax=Massilia sp. MB5 TaxID=2919578 RepID=UPI001F0EF642|nr:DUF535 family protein [Massilia sp. MB5]UMR29026.1 VirK/YbjX family protein [Massilia sp. MB5]